MKYKQFNLWLNELNINDTKYFWPAFLTRAPPPTITSLKPASPNRFSRTPRKTHVVWKSHILRLMKSLKSESCSSLTISTALGYMAWSKTKLVVVKFVVFHSLHLSWGAFYGRQISNDIFFSGCFWSFTQKPLHAWMTCFSQLSLCRSILQTMSSCFGIKSSSWLRSFFKSWIGSGFGRCLLLMYDWSSCETGLNERHY